MGPYVPRSKRGTLAAEEYVRPVEGVPAYLRSALLRWTRARFTVTGAPLGIRQDAISGRYLERIEGALRIDLGPFSAQERLDGLLDRVSDDGELWLDLIDFVLRKPVKANTPFRETPRFEAAADLAGILEDANSAWTVAHREAGGYFLARRVPAGADQALAEALEPADAAAHHLSAAWELAYQRGPSPGEAYREAVKAVESLACSLVEPNNRKSTLGTVLGVLKTTVGSGRWSATPPVTEQLVVEMMSALWQHQLGRHGAAGTVPPPANTAEEAQAAVHLSITLVQWLRSGAFRRA